MEITRRRVLLGIRECGDEEIDLIRESRTWEELTVALRSGVARWSYVAQAVDIIFDDVKMV